MGNFFFTTYPLFLRAIGTALLHSLWQGVLLSAVLLLFWTFVPHRNARLRYLGNYTALSLLFGWFVLTFVLEFQELARTSSEGVTTDLMVLAETDSTGISAPIGLQKWLSGPTVSTLLPYLSLIYFSGISAFGLKLIWEWRQLRRLRKGNEEATGDLQYRFHAYAARLIPGKRVRLLLTGKLNIPVVFGHFKPVILLPAALISGLSPEQLETILLHELAHIKRQDYLLNVIQSIMETFLFFNPAVWLISSRIRMEREHCCDDFVLQETRRPLPYAQALVTLAAIRGRRMQPALAATGMEKHSFFNRIKRITDMKHSTQKSQKVIVAMTVFFLSISLICFFTAFSRPDSGTAPVDEPQIVAVQSPVFAPEGEPDPETADRPGTTWAGIQQEKRQETTIRRPQGKGTIQEKTQPFHPGNQAGMENLSKETLHLVQEALELAQAEIAKVDWEGIQQTVSESMENIDWDEIGRTVERSISEVDWQQIESDVSQAMQAQGDLTVPDLKAELTEARQTMQAELKAGREEAKKQLAIAREELKTGRLEAQKQLAIAREELKAARIESDRALKEAQQEMEAARREFQAERAHQHTEK